MDPAKRSEPRPDRIAGGCEAIVSCSDGALSPSVAWLNVRPSYADRAASLQLPRTGERFPRLRAGVFAVFQHLRSVHEHVFHSDGILMRFLECRPIADRRRIEHHDVSVHPFLDEAAMIQSEIRRR